MKEHESLYFADFLIESHAIQCDFCGEVFTIEDVKPVQLDVQEGWTWLCSGCLESYDWKHREW